MSPTRLAAFFGATGVLCAAWGAHGLEAHAVEGGLRWWAIGAALQLATAPALLALAGLPTSRPRSVAGIALSVGLIVFCGSLYAMTLGAPRWLGAVTPLGGLSLCVGWIAVAFARNGR